MQCIQTVTRIFSIINMFEIYEFTLKNEKNSGLFQHVWGQIWTSPTVGLKKINYKI